MSSQYYSSLQKFVRFFYKDGDTRQQITENAGKCNVILEYFKINQANWQRRKSSIMENVLLYIFVNFNLTIVFRMLQGVSPLKIRLDQC